MSKHRLTLRLLKNFSAGKSGGAIVAKVPGDPACGDLITGTGGFRKVRFGRSGMGKRGGARIVYIFRGAQFPIFLIAAYGKNEKANLTKAERNELAKMADTMFTSYEGRP